VQDRRAYVKWKEVFLIGPNDLANDTLLNGFVARPQKLLDREIGSAPVCDSPS